MTSHAKDHPAARPKPERRAAPHLTLVHGSAASPAQWEPLIGCLPPDWRVQNVGLAGHDREHPLDAASYGLHVELDRLAPPPAAASPRVLVGHSMGGLIATAACLAHPGRYDALVLYEPTLFGLVAGAGRAPVQRDLQAFLRYFVSLRDPTRQLDAARAMFHFWLLFDAWEALSPAQRERVAAGMPKVRLECRLFDDPAVQADRLAALAGLPVTWVGGSESPAHIQAVRERLREVLPHAEVVQIPGAGHLGHVTHAGAVAALLACVVSDRSSAKPAPPRHLFAMS